MKVLIKVLLIVEEAKDSNGLSRHVKTWAKERTIIIKMCRGVTDA